GQAGAVLLCFPQFPCFPKTRGPREFCSSRQPRQKFTFFPLDPCGAAHGVSERARCKYNESNMNDQHAGRGNTRNEACFLKRTEVLRGGRSLAGLTLVRRALQIHNAGKNRADGYGPNQGSHACRKITHEHRSEERRVGKEGRSRWSREAVDK